MDDINRLIAEKLDPHYDPNMWEHSHVWTHDFVDFGKGNDQKRVHKEFDTDPAAMLSLIKVMRESNNWSGFVIHVWSILGLRDMTLTNAISILLRKLSPELIRDAAAKALGLEGEDV